MLDNIFKAQNKSHAILLVETKASNAHEFINNYMKSILPSASASKIDKHNYRDIITIDGYDRPIKKEEINNIIHTFSNSSLEIAGIKFYIVYGIENATHAAINSLLKFLEEPTVNTYAVLTTRALQKVLETIKSRCQVYRLNSNVNEFSSRLDKLEIEPELRTIINKIYYS
jgi:DNA polymerase-3 subunit delta'